MNNFAIYLHPETFATSKPVENIPFRKNSFPHYNQVRKALKKNLPPFMTTIDIRQNIEQKSIITRKTQFSR